MATPLSLRDAPQRFLLRVLRRKEAAIARRRAVGAVWLDGAATGHGTQGARRQSGHRPTLARGNDDAIEVDRGRTAHGNLDALESTTAQCKMMLYLGLTPQDHTWDLEELVVGGSPTLTSIPRPRSENGYDSIHSHGTYHTMRSAIHTSSCLIDQLER
jgi:hypothetical protein